MRARKRPLREALGFAMAAAALLQSGYMLVQSEDGDLYRWSSASLPIEVEVWNGFTSSPSVDPESRIYDAISEALARWARNSSISIVKSTTSAATVGLDNVNLITIADQPANRDVVGGALAVTLFWSRPSGGGMEIIESDVVFNPRPGLLWSTVPGDDRYNLFDVAVHELGHVVGLKHTVARSARMFVFAGQFNFGFSPLTWDDFAGLNRVYPLAGIELVTGSISGRVTKNGNPVFGAFVVAVDERGVLTASAVTRRDGSYELALLPPGRYALYVEPLDGPTVAAHVADSVFVESRIDADFRPRLYNDSTSPQVTVRADATTPGVNFSVSGGRTPVDPEFIGANSDPNGILWVNTSPAEVETGSDTNLVLAGAGVGDLLSNGGVEVFGSSLSSGSLQRTAVNSQETVFKVYSLSVPEDAPLGDYAVALRGGSGSGVISGGVSVHSPFRFLQAFGQFVHAPEAASSRIFLVNTDLNRAVDGLVSVRTQQGERAFPPVEGFAASAGGYNYRLPPGGSFSARTLGEAGFTGSLRIRGSGVVGGALLIESSSGTTGVGVSRPLHAFVAPVEVTGSGSSVNTGVAIANLDQRTVQVALRLHDDKGVLRGQRIVELEGNGQLAKFVGELIPIPGDYFRGTLLAAANRRIAATIIRTSPGVFTTFPVVEDRTSRRSLFAQFANSGSLTSELLLSNPSPRKSSDNVQIQVRRSDGSPASVTLNGVYRPDGRAVVSIPPLGMTSLKTSAGEVVGSVEVTATVPVGGVVLFSSPEFGTAGVGESFPAEKLAAPLERDAGKGMDTGIALFNPEARSVAVTLTARDLQGKVFGAPRSLTLRPLQQMARFSNDDGFALDLPDRFQGSLWIDADSPLAVTVLRQSRGVLTTFPAIDREVVAEGLPDGP